MQHGPQPGNSGGLEPSTNCSQGGLNWGDVMKLPKDAGQLHVLNAPGRCLMGTSLGSHGGNLGCPSPFGRSQDAES